MNKMKAEIDNAKQQSRKLLPEIHETSSADIISFFNKCVNVWGSNFKEQIAPKLTEESRYSDAEINKWGKMVGEYLFKDVGFMLDMLGPKGYRNFIDDWFPLDPEENGVLTHAEPHGIILNVGVENAFPMNLWVLTQILGTKNVAWHKSAFGDPVSVEAYIQTMQEADSDFPVANALSGFSWRGGTSDIEEMIVREVDAIAVTGAPITLKSYRGYAARSSDPNPMSFDATLKLIEFPPRNGYFIAKEPENLEDKISLAKGLSQDIADFNQQACYSYWGGLIQRHSKGSIKDYIIDYMVPAMQELSEKMPRGYIGMESLSKIASIVKNSLMDGFEVFPSLREKAEFRILYKDIDSDIPEIIAEHPHYRTLFIYEVDDLKEAIETDPNINKQVQTAGIFVPETERNYYKNQLTYRGVDRIIDIGTASIHSYGAPHDGMIPIKRLVRWVSDERRTL